MPRPHSRLRAVGYFCLSLAVGSCGDDPTGTTGRLQIVLSRGSVAFPLEVAPGGSTDTTTVHLVRPPGFTGPVQVTLSGLPAGVTAEGITIGVDQNMGELIFEASPEATQAVSTVTVQATGDNVEPGETFLGVRVRGPPSIGPLDNHLRLGG
jgi:hypothetical protein